MPPSWLIANKFSHATPHAYSNYYVLVIEKGSRRFTSFLWVTLEWSVVASASCVAECALLCLSSCGFPRLRRTSIARNIYREEVRKRKRERETHSAQISHNYPKKSFARIQEGMLPLRSLRSDCAHSLSLTCLEYPRLSTFFIAFSDIRGYACGLSALWFV